jgi:hypothetical protein
VLGNMPKRIGACVAKVRRIIACTHAQRIQHQDNGARHVSYRARSRKDARVSIAAVDNRPG